MIRKIKEDFHENWQYNLIFTIMIIINILSEILILKENPSLKEHKLFYMIIMISYILEIVYYIYIKKINFKFARIERVFLIVFIPIGILYMALFPIGTTPDEPAHYGRAFEISNGYLVSGDGGGRITPKEAIRSAFNSNYVDIAKKVNDPKTNEKTFFRYSNTALYSFICYLPQAIGMFIARTLGFSYLIQGYFGRMLNFITFTILIYHSIKLIPFKKLTILCLMLLPMMMQESINLSPDALTIGCSFLLISYVFHLKYSDKKINIKDKIFLAILTIVLSLCKIVYIPLCFILFLIPKDRFKSTKEKYIFVCLTIFVAMIANLIWLEIASTYLIEYNKGVNSKEQVMFILNNISEYIIILFKTISENFEVYISGIVGSSLGSFNVNISELYVFTLYAILYYFFLKDNNYSKRKLDSFTRIFSIVLLCGSIVLIFTSLYVQWTSVGAIKIEGVQGRYFIPLLLLFFISCSPTKVYTKYDKASLDYKIYNKLFICMISINILILYLIMSKYII